MFGYHDYKALHLVGLLFFLMSLIKLHTAEKHGKFFKSFLYTSAFITLSTGTILMVNWGLVAEMPPWIWGKFIATSALILSIWFPGRNSKFSKYRPGFIGTMVLLAVYCSIYKPI